MGDSLTRREFIKRSGLLGLGMAGGILIPSISEAVRFDRQKYKVTRTELLIGTVVSMTVVDGSKERADLAIGSAVEEMKRLEGILTRFDTISAVGTLNQDGSLKDIPRELAGLVEDSLKFNRITHGAFDITVKPVLDLYEKAFKAGGVPKEEELQRLTGLIGTQYLRLGSGSLFFEREGMGITLDGIAKGFIVDRAGAVLEKKGVTDYLINAGGDIRVRGERKEGGPWKIAIQDPLKSREFPDVIELSEGSIATSGDYEVYYDNERFFHHIVDPKTAKSPLELSSVSVLAKDTEEADALSTALFVMGPKGAKEFVSQYPCQCLMITRDGSLIASKGWKGLKVQG